MRVVYLIQSDTPTIPHAIPAGSDVLLLQWADTFVDVRDSFHLPRSSWAEGRNELYRRAREGGYDYYTFLDDDIELEFVLDEFEALLAEHRPRRAVPWLNHQWNLDRRGEIDLVKYIDHIFMAVRADCAETILPYTTDFDLTNWWLTGEEMCDRVWEHWALGTYRFNDLTVKNLEHRSYPKLDYPGLPEQVLCPLEMNSDGPR